MIYSKKLVVAVKVRNKVLREDGDLVYIPFNSEYTLQIKNLDSVKAVVSIAIDGANVTDNRQIIVPANSSVELEGFIKNDKVTNKFKFIERTSAISNYRGNKIEDGLIRASYRFEKKIEPITLQPYWYTNTVYREPLYGASNDSTHWYSTSDVSSSFIGNACNSTLSKSVVSSDIGITTKGSNSSQKFVTGSTNTLEDIEHVLVLHLKGEIRNKKVVTPVVVTTKLTCDMCGKKNKSNNKFCGRCGTALF